MVFHWSLSDSKSPQVSRTLLSVLAVLSNAVVWMVFTRPPTFKSSSPFSNPFVTVPKAPITIGIIVTCMFHSFFNSLAKSRYVSFFSHSFSFILWSTGTAKSTILQFHFFFCWLLLGLVFWPRFGDPSVCLSVCLYVCIIIINFFLKFQLNFRFLTFLHWGFTWDLDWWKVVIICILCIYVFSYFFWVIYFSHLIVLFRGDKKFRKVQFVVFRSLSRSYPRHHILLAQW